MVLKKLRAQFKHRQDLIDYIVALNGDGHARQVSPTIASQSTADRLLGSIKPQNYAKTRNHLGGQVTKLSPFISTGIINSVDVYQKACEKLTSLEQGEKLFQELAWREFWQQVATHHPQWLWKDIECYKTGFNANDYADELPEDIQNANTDCMCINQLIRSLYETGYLHNHARMYVASYIIHWRRVKWQVGAKWFLYHLLDANVASNNFSWQWIASTFSQKPYIFNLDNIRKFSSSNIDTSSENNSALDKTYELLITALFPNKEAVK
jgi:deoxyribodipyrimidine photo-lyase